MITVRSLFFHHVLAWLLLVGQTGVLAEPSEGLDQRNTIDNIIIEELEKFRANMATGWPDIGIPPLDPLDVGFVNVSVATANNRLQGTLEDVVLENLSTFTIEEVHTSMLLPKAEVTLGIADLHVAGLYDLTGILASVVPVYGSGHFSLAAMDVVLSMETKLHLDLPGISVKTLDINIAANKTVVDLEGIMGGGEASEFINGVLSSLGPQILQALENKFMPQLEETLKELINNALHSGRKIDKREVLKDDSVNHFFDLLFANIRHEILESGLDPLALPEDSDNFTVTLFNQTLQGWVKLGEGHVAGVATLHRAGNMTLQYVGDADEAIVGGVIGLTGVKAEYGFRLNLGLFKKHLKVILNLSYVSLDIETGIFLHPLNITLDHCTIASLGPVHINVSGAGFADSPLENLLINALLPLLQEQVQKALGSVVCGLLGPALAGGK